MSRPVQEGLYVEEANFNSKLADVRRVQKELHVEEASVDSKLAQDIDQHISQHDAGGIRNVPGSGLVEEANTDADLDKESMIRQVPIQKVLQLPKLDSEEQGQARDMIRAAQNARVEDRDIIRTAQKVKPEATSAHHKSWDHIMSKAPLLSFMFSMLFEEPVNPHVEDVDKNARGDAQSVMRVQDRP